jgi:hypothetical protein
MNVSHLFGEVRDAGPEPDVPLIFLSALGSDAFAEELTPPEARASAAETGRAKHRLYTDLAAARPRSEVRRLDDVGHSGLATHRPDAVVQAVRDVLSGRPGHHQR